MDQESLKTFDCIPEPFRRIFSSYPCLNKIQSAVYDTVFHSNDSIVVTAPTGSGKTVLFELAIVKQIIEAPQHKKFKAVYVAPVKALCSERFHDWRERFKSLGVSCIECTGDSPDTLDLQDHQIILTTPEKWDSITRRWRDNRGLVQQLRLFLLDEIHLLNDPRRGPVLETIVCRMKTMSKVLKFEADLRFIAVSATIFNIEDIGNWLSGGDSRARCFKFGNEMRPVVLKRIVRGFHQPTGQSPFVFDIQLSYKLKPILLEHADGKPVLIFCSTRRSVLQTSKVLVDQLSFEFSPEQLNALYSAASLVSDGRLRDGIIAGVGFHHAGVSAEDRFTVQNLFLKGALPVLVSTSTLAMGVNLPAHLVIVKSTTQYIAGRIEEYTDSAVLQMVGRAGRPQFDTSATAVILTRREMVQRYEMLLDCREVIESSLHLHLPEQLNAEIVLFTITDLGVAMDWIRCTFLYQRALQNPRHYGFAPGNVQRIEKDLETLVLRDFNALNSLKLVQLDNNGIDIAPTEDGRLISHFYISIGTFRLFLEITGQATMSDILFLLTKADELKEVQLRVSERRVLNELNSSKKLESIRFPSPGKILSSSEKANCLVQAILGCLDISDSGLQQEARRIVSILERILKCLAKFLIRKNQYCAFLSATILAKCLRARLWENTLYVSKQLERIGATLSSALVSCGKTSFSALEMTHPRELERILNRAPPMGNVILEQIQHLPRYDMKIEIRDNELIAYIALSNEAAIRERNAAGGYHSVTFLVGDSSNRILNHRKIMDSTLIKGALQISVTLPRWKPQKVFAHLISGQLVGLDVSLDLTVDPSVSLIVGFHCHINKPQSKATTAPRKKQKTIKESIKVQSPFTKKLLNKPTQSLDKHAATIREPVVKCCFDVEPDEFLQDTDHTLSFYEKELRKDNLDEVNEGKLIKEAIRLDEITAPPSIQVIEKYTTHSEHSSSYTLGGTASEALLKNLDTFLVDKKDTSKRNITEAMICYESEQSVESYSTGIYVPDDHWTKSENSDNLCVIPQSIRIPSEPIKSKIQEYCEPFSKINQGVAVAGELSAVKEKNTFIIKKKYSASAVINFPKKKPVVKQSIASSLVTEGKYPVTASYNTKDIYLYSNSSTVQNISQKNTPLLVDTHNHRNEQFVCRGAYSKNHEEYVQEYSLEEKINIAEETEDLPNIDSNDTIQQSSELGYDCHSGNSVYDLRSYSEVNPDEDIPHKPYIQTSEYVDSCETACRREDIDNQLNWIPGYVDNLEVPYKKIDTEMDIKIKTNKRVADNAVFLHRDVSDNMDAVDSRLQKTTAPKFTYEQDSREISNFFNQPILNRVGNNFTKENQTLERDSVFSSQTQRVDLKKFKYSRPALSQIENSSTASGSNAPSIKDTENTFMSQPNVSRKYFNKFVPTYKIMEILEADAKKPEMNFDYLKNSSRSLQDYLKVAHLAKTQFLSQPKKCKFQ